MRNFLSAARVVGLTVVLSLLLTSQQQHFAQVKSQQSAAPTPVTLKTNVKKAELASRLERVIPQLMKDGDVPGLSVLVIREGRVFWQRAFGVANADTKQPVTDSTVFEAASLSKPVFAYAVLKLVDSGKLDLDTPLVKYLPGSYDVEGDERLNHITARHVLTHRTGFPNWRPHGGALKIHFTPGEKFSYSGEGFVYLQKTVERLAGLKADDFVKKMVFDPLGMTSSSYVWQERFKTLKAFGHNQAGNVTAQRQPKEANVAGSLNTTASDYAKFVIAVMNGTGLKKETAKLMLTPQVKVDEACGNCIGRWSGKNSPYISWGLGWGLQRTDEGDAFWHWGDSNNDVHAYIVAFEKQRLGVMVFTDSGNGHSIIPEIVREAIGGQQPALAWIKYEPYNSPARMLLKDILARGETAIKEYRERHKNPSEMAAALNENQVNRLGYQLLGRKRVKEAIEVFKWNVEDYPQSSNVYDSLGEAYMVGGERELAIKNYQKSVELDPKNDNGIQMLKKLQAQ